MDNTAAPKKKSGFWDFNASWILMFVYVIYLGGMFFLQKSIYETSELTPSVINYYVFVFVALLIGLVASAILYNLSRIIAAKIKGYKILYTKMLGFTIRHDGKKRTTFSIMDVFSLEMRFVPKNDDIKKNPRPIFFAGWIGELIFAAICLVLYFVLAGGKKEATRPVAIGEMALFSMIYGLVVLLYEIMPFRQDAATDMFNLMVTKEPIDREAFNLLYVNRRRELTGENFLVPEDDDFDSYYREKVLYYHYLDRLYHDDLENAVNDLVLFRKNRKKLDDYDRYLSSAEAMYLRYLSSDSDGADKLYLTLKGEERSMLTKPSELADYRSSLLIVGFITGDKEQIKQVELDFKAKLEGLDESERVKKEKALFLDAYKTLREGKPSLGLPESLEVQL